LADSLPGANWPGSEKAVNRIFDVRILNCPRETYSTKHDFCSYLSCLFFCVW